MSSRTLRHCAGKNVRRLVIMANWVGMVPVNPLLFNHSVAAKKSVVLGIAFQYHSPQQFPYSFVSKDRIHSAALQRTCLCQNLRDLSSQCEEADSCVREWVVFLLLLRNVVMRPISVGIVPVNSLLNRLRMPNEPYMGVSEKKHG